MTDTELGYEADRIRAKTGGSSPILFVEGKGFGDAIDAIQTGGGGSDEKLLASGTYTVSAAASSITINTGISNLDATKTCKALVVGDLTSGPGVGFMKWFSVVYIRGPETLTDAVGEIFPKARYYNSAATAGGIANYQTSNATNSLCYIGSGGSTIVCRQFSNNYKIQPATYTWYLWGEEST